MDKFVVNVLSDFEADSNGLENYGSCNDNCNCDCHGGGCYCITD